MPNKSKKRQGSTAVAEPETETNEVEGATVVANQDAGPTGRRLPHVDAEQFKALRDELKMSNKDMSEAIQRTLARVSELTTSQGASIETWNRVEKQMRDWREAHPVDAGKDGQTASADSGDSSES